MRHLLFHGSWLCLALLLELPLAHASELDGKSPTPPRSVPPVKPAKPVKPIVSENAEGACGSHGTRIEFVDTPREAAKIAKKEQKLVFVLHVSGNFEDPRFT